MFGIRGSARAAPVKLAGGVKLLFDENLSPCLVTRLDRVFPGSAHVELIGLRGQADQVLWDYAGLHGFTLVSKDNDFRQLSFLRVREKTVASEGRSRSAGAQEPECILKYMRIPSTAGTRDPERSRFFHKLSGEHHQELPGSPWAMRAPTVIAKLLEYSVDPIALFHASTDEKSAGIRASVRVARNSLGALRRMDSTSFTRLNIACWPIGAILLALVYFSV